MSNTPTKRVIVFDADGGDRKRFSLGDVSAAADPGAMSLEELKTKSDEIDEVLEAAALTRGKLDAFIRKTHEWLMRCRECHCALTRKAAYFDHCQPYSDTIGHAHTSPYICARCYHSNHAKAAYHSNGPELYVFVVLVGDKDHEYRLDFDKMPTETELRDAALALFETGKKRECYLWDIRMSDPTRLAGSAEATGYLGRVWVENVK